MCASFYLEPNVRPATVIVVAVGHANLLWSVSTAKERMGTLNGVMDLFDHRTIPSFRGDHNWNAQQKHIMSPQKPSKIKRHQHHEDGEDQSGIGRDRFPDPFPDAKGRTE